MNERDDSFEDDPGVRERLQRQAEDAIGKLADELLENPVFNSALSGAFAAREKMASAQQQAMGALNLPSASDLDKLERRIRSISRRLDEVEDTVERVFEKLDAFADKLDAAAASEALWRQDCVAGVGEVDGGIRQRQERSSRRSSRRGAPRRRAHDREHRRVQRANARARTGPGRRCVASCRARCATRNSRRARGNGQTT